MASGEKFSTRQPEFTILADHPILRGGQFDKPARGAGIRDPDSFHLESRLAAIYDIIRHRSTQTPTAIAFYGDWGTGKTSAMRWLQSCLDHWTNSKNLGGHAAVYSVWFDPWKYRDREDVWRGIIAEVVLHCIKVENLNAENLETNLRQAAKQFGGFLGRSFLHALKSIKLKFPAAEVDGRVFQDIYDEYAKVNHPEKAYLNEFEEELKRWVTRYFPQEPTKEIKTPRRLAIFIDDLDRCLPEVTLEVLEALKLYLNIPGLVFVVGLDQDVVRSVIRKHYDDHGLGKAKADKYLEKMFQVEYEIPPSGPQFHGYAGSMFRQLDAQTDDRWSAALNDAGRACCNGQRDSDSTHVRRFIEHALESLCGMNPRQGKRLINSTLMRAVAAQRNDDLGGTPPLRFAQGAQVFLVQHHLRDRYVQLQNVSLIRDDNVVRALEHWSAFACRHEAYRSYDIPADGSAGDSADDFATQDDWMQRKMEGLLQRKPARGSKSSEAGSGGGGGGWDELVAEVQKRLGPAERFGGLAAEWLKDEQLWRLMCIPWNPRVIDVVAPTEVDEPAAQAPAPDAATSGKPAVASEDARDAGGRFERMPDFLKNAIARELKKNVQQVRDQDLASVTMLDLRGIQAEGDWLSHLSGLTSLETLVLSQTSISDAGLKHLSGLASLQGLHLSQTSISDAGLSHLSGLTSLEWLDLSQTSISDAGLSHLSGLTSLQVLILSQTSISDAGLSHLSGLTSLEHLNLSQTSISGAGLSHLSGLASLEWLNLSQTSISDAGLSHLSGLTSLKWLNLSQTSISDAGLSHLSGLTSLKWLNLSQTSISDAGLKHLACLTVLWRLDLSQTSISDAGLAHLLNLKMLKQVNLEGTGASYPPRSGWKWSF